MDTTISRDPCFMDVFVRDHRGPDPTNPEVLCTEAAREKMMAYGVEMTQRHGPDFDWRQAEVDAEALHTSGGGRRHGRYAFGNGVVDYDQTRRSSSSSKEIEFVVWEFSLLKDSSRYLDRGGGSCSTRGGSSGNTNGRGADKHDSLHGFLHSEFHSSIGTRRKLATVLPSSNVSAARVDRVGATTPGFATTFGVDDDTLGLPNTSGVDGTTGLGAISKVDGTAGLLTRFGVDGTTGLSANSQLDGTARLPATFGVDATPGLNATFGVDASCCTTLQPVDAITSSALWITGFGLTSSWPNSRCGRE
ncbi:hypothetical protein U9M48_014189 [Paspalum notatum var. saurae]|uniref:Uncharacterized protein n=1 Tax=Paspalum notatum var. saurae TaxID=547442 RepID=A0AAQ3WKE9_PASNO